MSDDALIRRENLKALGKSATELAALMGKTPQYWRDLMQTEKSFGEKAARGIEEKLGLARGQLDQAGAVFRVKEPGAKYNEPDEFVIPQFDTGGSMGDGLVLRDQPGMIRGWTVNREWLAKNIKNHTGSDNLCIVTGFGDSMKGMYNSGDPLVVDTGVNTVEYDAVYFFRVGHEGFIKRLQRIPGEGLVAISENKAYRDWTIKPEMDFEVFGRVLKAWKGEEF